MIISGDVNPEYLDYYQEINLIDARLRKLNTILKNAILIQPPQKENQDAVYPGAMVVVKNGNRKDRFQITGSAEANPDAGRISVESPVGFALLGHRVGEKIFIPAVQAVYQILSVEYQSV